MFVKNEKNILEEKKLFNIELILSEKVQDISVLGQLLLSAKEIKHLKEVMKENVGMLTRTPSFLKNTAPVTTSLFLLYVGCREYLEGNFWDPIYQAMDINNISSNWNTIFGNIFYSTIKKKELKEFDPGGNKYVNQILAHGMIPDNYLEEFFEKFLYKECRDIIELDFVFEDVKQKLKNIRKDQQGFRDLTENIRKKEEKTNKLSKNETNYSLVLDNYQSLNELSSLYKKQLNLDEVDELLSLPENYLEEKKDDLRASKSNIEKIQRHLEDVNDQKQKIKQREKEFINCKEQLSEIKKKKKSLLNEIDKIAEEVFSTSFSESLLEIIKDMSLYKLKVELIRYHRYSYSDNEQGLFSLFKKIKMFLKGYYFILSGHRNKIYSKIKKMLSELPLKKDLLEEPKLFIYEKLNNIQKKAFEIEDLNKRINIFQNKMLDYKYEILDNYSSGKPDIFTVKNEIENKKEKLNTELNVLTKKKIDIEEDIRDYKMKLNSISGGQGIEKGKIILEEEREIRNKIEDILENIDLGKDKIAVIKMIAAVKKKKEIKVKLFIIKNKLHKLENELNELKIKSENHHPRLYSLIEPTRIFLFQGGNVATKFVFNCLKLLQKLRNDEANNINSEVLLPSKIQKVMTNWWQRFENRELEKKEKLSASERKMKNIQPFLKYNSSLNKIVIHIPEQKFQLSSSNKEQPTLLLLDTKGNIIDKNNLILYKLKDDLFKTEKQEVDCPSKWEHLKILINIGEKDICKKEFNLQQYYFLRNDKVIDGNPLNYQEISLILGNRLQVQPEDIIIQERQLSGAWSNYFHYFLDSTQTKMIFIVDEEDNIIESYRGQQEIEPELIGGNISKYFTRDDACVYIEKDPLFVFSPGNHEELRLWQIRVSINKDKDIMNFNLNERKNELREENGLIRFSLQTLIDNKRLIYGLYQIRIVRRGPYSRNWDFTYVFLPQININFDKKIYPCIDNNDLQGKAEIKTPDNCNLKFTENQQIKRIKGDKTFICFNPGLEKIKANFISNIENNQFEIMMNLNIPVITWKIKGSDFETNREQKVEEFWHEDLYNMAELNLEVFLPAATDCQIGRLLLNEREQVLFSRIQQYVLQFDMMKFSDNIRKHKRPVQKLNLELKDSSGNFHAPFTLLKIRTKWEVFNLNCNTQYMENECKVELSWQEKGRADSKEIIIWDQLSEKKVYFSNIEERGQIVMTVSGDKLPPGNYVLQFKEKELWDIAEDSFPALDDLNVFEVVIGDKEDIIGEMKKYGLRINAIESENGSKHVLGNEYVIPDIQEVKAEKLDFTGEKRYEGQLLFFKKEKDRLVIERVKPFPVSFYFEEEKFTIPFIVDKDRDGFTFCSNCEKIFMEMKDKSHNSCDSKFQSLPLRYYVEINRSQKNIEERN